MIFYASAKIRKFCVDDASCDERGMGMTLIVDLDNGSTMLFSLDSKANKPLFKDVLMNRCGKPKTDGNRVYWPNGASLSLRDMFAIMQTKQKAGAAL